MSPYLHRLTPSIPDNNVQLTPLAKPDPSTPAPRLNITKPKSKSSSKSNPAKPITHHPKNQKRSIWEKLLRSEQSLAYVGWPNKGGGGLTLTMTAAGWLKTQALLLTPTRARHVPAREMLCASTFFSPPLPLPLLLLLILLLPPCLYTTTLPLVRKSSMQMQGERTLQTQGVQSSPAG
ncbi:hypothetical protein BO99DRAFT_473809 [Aspergillus violaceofuscus CBS 115571]|uniref:Uncharacterized protein n=1 Tax=Aspergillus violaceofuscus (strain CBS 115571) TaxID=1450538 RepID=A0A2V5HA36_ASPV1|nr:hypothetical protein BO99DRAFT_473809 [Aspergillus violaceofuscus CBS 115571]